MEPRFFSYSQTEYEKNNYDILTRLRDNSKASLNIPAIAYTVRKATGIEANRHRRKISGRYFILNRGSEKENIFFTR